MVNVSVNNPFHQYQEKSVWEVDLINNSTHPAISESDTTTILSIMNSFFLTWDFALTIQQVPNAGGLPSEEL